MARFFLYIKYIIQTGIVIVLLFFHLSAKSQIYSNIEKIKKIHQLTEFVHWPFENDISDTLSEFRITVLRLKKIRRCFLLRYGTRSVNAYRRSTDKRRGRLDDRGATR